MFSGNIYCIGRNYRAHAEELQNEVPEEPVVFLKSPSALRSWQDRGVAFKDEIYHHEIELVLLIDDTDQSNTSPYGICGMTLGIDLTRRGLQNRLKAKQLPWTTSKNFAGSGILGPWKPVTPAIIQKPVDLTLYVNGERRQKGSTENLIFSFKDLLKWIHDHHSLEKGDIIFTGTPEGVNHIQPWERIRGVSRTLEIDSEGLL